MAILDLGKVTGNNGTSMRYHGLWAEGVEYVNNEQYIDIVTHGGCLWICSATNTDEPPSEEATSWHLAASGMDNGTDVSNGVLFGSPNTSSGYLTLGPNGGGVYFPAPTDFHTHLYEGDISKLVKLSVVCANKLYINAEGNDNGAVFNPFMPLDIVDIPMLDAYWMNYEGTGFTGGYVGPTIGNSEYGLYATVDHANCIHIFSNSDKNIAIFAILYTIIPLKEV